VPEQQRDGIQSAIRNENMVDCPVPFHYATSMDWLYENALLSGSCLWHSKDDEPWLVSFDFAEVDGRLECVGMRLRSFIESEAEDEFGPHRAYLSGEISTDDLFPKPQPLPKVDMLDPQSRAAYLKAVEEQEITPPHPALEDSDATAAILGDPTRRWAPQSSPRPLRTATLRELPLGSLLADVRKQAAAAWRSGIMAPRAAAHPVGIELSEEMQDFAGAPFEERQTTSAEREVLEQRTWELLQKVKRNGGWDDELIRERDELGRLFAELEEREGPRPELKQAPHPTIPAVQIDAAEFLRLTQQAAGSFNAPGQKAGRPAKYSPAQLELVARTYRQAFADGSPSPTRDVAEKLGLSRSQAAKLVMRCRDPRVGLLGPTKARQAGGLEPPPTGDREAGEGAP